MALIARDNNGGDSIGAGYGITVWDGDTLVDSLYFEDGDIPDFTQVYSFLSKHSPVTVEDTANPEEIYSSWKDYVRDMEAFYTEV